MNLRQTAKNCSFTFPIFAPSNVRSIASRFWQKSKRKAANARLIMVGDGPERSACYYRAEQLNSKMTWFCRQTGEYRRLSGHRRRFSAAVRARILRTRRARSRGLRSSRHRDAHRRHSRSRVGRRNRISKRHRRHGENVGRRDEIFQ